uniref:Fork-head domain-containing protein n=1 Tax=Trichuris muris TaxID=70415 RepID=A0A5S6QFJ8_TRIMR
MHSSFINLLVFVLEDSSYTWCSGIQVGECYSAGTGEGCIRHNLWQHSRFKRIQNEGPGKSSWWIIDPDSKAGEFSSRHEESTEVPNKLEKKRGRVRKKMEHLRSKKREKNSNRPLEGSEDLPVNLNNSVELSKSGSNFRITAQGIVEAIDYVEENEEPEYRKLETIFEGRIKSTQPKCYTTALSLASHGLAMACQQLYHFRIMQGFPAIIVLLTCGVLLQLLAGKRQNSTEYTNCMLLGLFWGCYSVMSMLPLLGIKPPDRTDMGVFFIAYSVYFIIYTVGSAPVNTVQFFFGVSMFLCLALTSVNHFSTVGPIGMVEY